MAKNQNKHLENKSILSILVARDGLYFCISTGGKKITHFYHQHFSTPQSPEALLQEIKATLTYSFDAAVLEKIDNLKVYYAHPYYALVPRPYFLEEKLSEYLKFNTALLATDELNYDRLAEMNANLVYVPYTNVNNYLLDKFGEFTYQHAVSVFIDQCINSSNKAKQEFFIQVYPTHFDCGVFKEGELQLCNSYDYFAPEDLVYYVLFIVEQLGLDPEEFELKITGDLLPDTETHKLLTTYIRHIQFAPNSLKLELQPETLKNAPPHLYQFLINTVAYENRLRKV